MVETERGPKAIDALEPGERVLSISYNDQLDYGPVTRTYKTIACGYYLINNDIAVTGTHQFRVNDRWVNVEDLTVGDRLVQTNGESILVASIQKVNRVVRVYNIEVGG